MATVSEWYRFATVLRATAVLMLHSVQYPLDDEQKKYAISLLARTISNFDGAVLLHKQGQIVEARVLMRCCYENLFYLGALAKEGSKLIEAMKRDDLATRGRRGKQLLEKKIIDSESEGGKELRAFLKGLDKAGRSLDPLGVSNMSVVSQGYVLYGLASDDAAHPTVRSLSRHTILTPEGGVFSIEPTIEDDEPEGTINFTCSALLGACFAAGKVLGGSRAAPEVKQRLAEIERLQGLMLPPSAEASKDATQPMQP